VTRVPRGKQDEIALRVTDVTSDVVRWHTAHVSTFCMHLAIFRQVRVCVLCWFIADNEFYTSDGDVSIPYMAYNRKLLNTQLTSAEKYHRSWNYPSHAQYLRMDLQSFYWTFTDFSVSWSYTLSVGLLGRGINRRKAATYTQNKRT
jgi:hypothetical protein